MTDRTDRARAVTDLLTVKRVLHLATEGRLTAVRNARDAGMTWAEIGSWLGVSEAAVRQLIKRNPDRAA